MKELAFGLVFILVIGIGGFIYRNAIERPLSGGLEACTLEARLCPDGTGVGRSGPDCSFAPCPFPNIEIQEAGISFALPAGYEQVLIGASGQETLRIFSKPSLSPSVQHAIHVKRYPIPSGGSADAVILTATRYQPADMPAENFDRFTLVNLGGRTYRATVIERFEALVQSSYFLARENDVLRFDIIEHDVTNWTDPNLAVENLPEHRALQAMLGTLQGN